MILKMKRMMRNKELAYTKAGNTVTRFFCVRLGTQVCRIRLRLEVNMA